MALYKFLVVGVANTASGLIVIYSAMYFFGLDPILSNLSGYVFGFFLGYILNKNWAFKSKGTGNRRIALYLMVILIAYLSNISIVQVSINYLLLNPYIAQLIGMLAYTAISFVGCKRFVFPGAN